MVVERNLSVPSGRLPFQGRLLGQGQHAAFSTSNFLRLTLALSSKAFRRLYTVSRRNAMERNRRRPRLCPPGKAPILAMAGSSHGVRGPALVTWKIWLAPGRLCLLCPSSKYFVRPQTDEILSSWHPSAVVCRQDCAYGCDLINYSIFQRMSLSSIIRPADGGKNPP